MRVYLTGASGFVGSNVAHVLERHGWEVVGPSHEEVDLTDARATRRSLTDARPDAVVHSAIWNAFTELLADRRRAWDSFVGATRNVVDAANAAGAQVVLVSTDWVFDGTQSPASEETPPNPINHYGFLKAMSELVVAERAERGTVARIAGVQGVHRARPQTLRVQDVGFGYLVASVVEALRDGRRFVVWEGPGLNTVSTPTLATDAADRIRRAIELGLTGTLHCVGGEHVDRVTLARRSAAAFGLDAGLVDVGPPDATPFETERVPYDTSLDATATAAALGLEPLDLDTMLGRLRAELEDAWSAA